MPLLRDFDIYFPRPLTDKDNQILIENRSRSILAGLSVFFKPRIKTNEVRKISIFLNGNRPQNHLKTFGGILHYIVPFDEQKFLSSCIEDQKNFLLDFLIKHLKIAFDEIGLDSGRLDNFKQFIENREYKNTFKGPISKLDNRSARVIVSQGFEKSEVYLLIQTGRAESSRHFLLETSANEFSFAIYLNKPIWISDHQIRVSGLENEAIIVDL